MPSLARWTAPTSSGTCGNLLDFAESLRQFREEEILACALHRLCQKAERPPSQAFAPLRLAPLRMLSANAANTAAWHGAPCTASAVRSAPAFSWRALAPLRVFAAFAAQRYRGDTKNQNSVA